MATIFGRGGGGHLFCYGRSGGDHPRRDSWSIDNIPSWLVLGLHVRGDNLRGDISSVSNGVGVNFYAIP